MLARGIGMLDLSGGYAVGPIPAGGAVAINLRSLRHWLAGIVTLTDCAGLVAVSLPDAMSLRTSPVYSLAPIPDHLIAIATPEGDLWVTPQGEIYVMEKQL